MTQLRTWAAFDVHVSGVVAAMLDRESGELRVWRLPGQSEEVAFAAGLSGPLRAAYEAGPTGFVLARKLEVSRRVRGWQPRAWVAAASFDGGRSPNASAAVQCRP